MSTKLGSLRSCSARNILSKTSEILPQEYAHNRVSFIGAKNVAVEAMLMCDKVTNITVRHGQSIPNNSL